METSRPSLLLLVKIIRLFNLEIVQADSLSSSASSLSPPSTFLLFAFKKQFLLSAPNCWGQFLMIRFLQMNDSSESYGRWKIIGASLIQVALWVILLQKLIFHDSQIIDLSILMRSNKAACLSFLRKCVGKLKLRTYFHALSGISWRTATVRRP
eukprot:TRINITY_DN19021_c0_g2_i1.p1 TRINITY_DN19021_c0_g2~~TRINITY_DN19021_c0_g2_i1.p1  ORF type:complete len:154 (-),score=10.70 TRINITY_DN19021_c0_g2_i1:669-1130(-)